MIATVEARFYFPPEPISTGDLPGILDKITQRIKDVDNALLGSRRQVDRELRDEVIVDGLESWRDPHRSYHLIPHLDFMMGQTSRLEQALLEERFGEDYEYMTNIMTLSHYYHDMAYASIGQSLAVTSREYITKEVSVDDDGVRQEIYHVNKEAINTEGDRVANLVKAATELAEIDVDIPIPLAPPGAKINEYASAVRTIVELAEAGYSDKDIMMVVTPIIATIPFDGRNYNVFAEKLTEVTDKYNIEFSEQDVKNAMIASISVANRDVASFAGFEQIGTDPDGELSAGGLALFLRSQMGSATVGQEMRQNITSPDAGVEDHVAVWGGMQFFFTQILGTPLEAGDDRVFSQYDNFPPNEVLERLRSYEQTALELGGHYAAALAVSAAIADGYAKENDIKTPEAVDSGLNEIAGVLLEKVRIKGEAIDFDKGEAKIHAVLERASEVMPKSDKIARVNVRERVIVENNPAVPGGLPVFGPDRTRYEPSGIDHDQLVLEAGPHQLGDRSVVAYDENLQHFAAELFAVFGKKLGSILPEASAYANGELDFGGFKAVIEEKLGKSLDNIIVRRNREGELESGVPSSDEVPSSTLVNGSTVGEPAIPGANRTNPEPSVS